MYPNAMVLTNTQTLTASEWHPSLDLRSVVDVNANFALVLRDNACIGYENALTLRSGTCRLMVDRVLYNNLV